MKCIYCGHKRTAVKNSRPAGHSLFVWRRRFCEQCKALFTTTESAFADNLFVLKRNGRKQRFSYEKLLVSLVYALERGKGNDRGDQAKLAKVIAEKIIASLLKARSKTVPTSRIIELSYGYLRKEGARFAEAYMHYSAYREKICSPLRQTVGTR